MSDRNEDRVLYALFCLSRATLPIDIGGLSEVTGLPAITAGEALLRLERAGYADATRARLTMAGLVRAVALKTDLGGCVRGPGLGSVRARPEREEQRAAGARRALVESRSRISS